MCDGNGHGHPEQWDVMESEGGPETIPIRVIAIALGPVERR